WHLVRRSESSTSPFASWCRVAISP
ncbi:MAG: hypothetical protein AVDCRST_MAG75-394, partial [uncultured Propionibacteriaceae bacterium]